MIRHSISQIFTSNTPHEQSTKIEEMISSLQPSRPRIQPQSQPHSSHVHHPSPTNQQQTRALTSPPPIQTFQPQAQTYAHPPRSQMEAMPPNITGVQALERPARGIVLDAAKRHPVFFTERLKKAPNGVGDGGGSWSSPVALGYVFNDGVRRRVDGVVKL